jgi:Zn-dependent protease
MTQFYKANLGKISWAEHRRICQTRLGLIQHGIISMLRLPISQLQGLTRPQAGHEARTDFASLPARSAEKLREQVEECTALGFAAPIFKTDTERLLPGESSSAYLLHGSGQAIARITYWTVMTETLVTSFISKLSDGTWLWTTNVAYQLDPAPNVKPLVCREAGGAELWKVHTSRLLEARRTCTVVMPASENQFAQLCDEFDLGNFDYLVTRGVYVPLSEKEIEHARKLKTLAPAADIGVEAEHAGIFAELTKMQHSAPRSWMKSLSILAISMVAFVAAGMNKQHPAELLGLILVLLVHELGHYAAMRAFKYRNVQMFFIPFFGAAVTGRSFSVAGYKKAIVSLMGPLPGIAIGVILGLIAIFTSTPTLIPCALLFLILNGFNLLPFLPLDGGWFFQTVLFSRSIWFEMFFRVVTVLALLGLSTAMHSKIFMYLAIIMAVALPQSLRTGKLAKKLRGTIPPPTDENGDIHPAAAGAIIRDVKAAMPSLKGPKQIAVTVTNIYERIFSRPPSALASIGLTAAYGGALLVALVFTSILAVRQNPVAWKMGKMRAEMRRAAAAQQHTQPYALELKESSMHPVRVSILPEEPSTKK